MANPKNRWSKARTSRHHSLWNAEVPPVSTCPRCHEPKLPHRICLNCGTYAGRLVITVGDDKK